MRKTEHMPWGVNGSSMEGLAFRKPSEKGQMKHRQATTEWWEILLEMHILANGN